MPSQQKLKSLFNYIPETGQLVRIKAPRNNQTGSRPGTVAGWTNQGYRNAKVDGKPYRLHRLIWVWVYGSIPDGMNIDHLDGDGLNNRLDNLRLVDQSINSKNRKLAANNKSGRVGVCFNKAKNKWSAQIIINGKQKHLGYFSSIDAAANAREKAEVGGLYTLRHGKKTAT